MILTQFRMLGFAKPIFPQWLIKKQNAVYGESESVALPLNPTYGNWHQNYTFLNKFSFGGDDECA